jgi:hypothetical protein
MPRKRRRKSSYRSEARAGAQLARALRGALLVAARFVLGIVEWLIRCIRSR